MLRDTASSSGTFLNHIRLSSPSVESRPFPLKDGDVIQLGVDYQGGTEEIYRCVKIRVELNRVVGGREAFKCVLDGFAHVRCCAYVVRQHPCSRADKRSGGIPARWSPHSVNERG